MWNASQVFSTSWISALSGPKVKEEEENSKVGYNQWLTAVSNCQWYIGLETIQVKTIFTKPVIVIWKEINSSCGWAMSNSILLNLKSWHGVWCSCSGHSMQPCLLYQLKVVCTFLMFPKFCQTIPVSLHNTQYHPHLQMCIYVVSLT